MIIRYVVAIILCLATFGVAPSFALGQDIPTGSIAGRVIDERLPDAVQSYSLLVLPADTAQPIPSDTYITYHTSTDTDGTFEVGALQDGDYLVAFTLHDLREGVSGVEELLTEMPENVTFETPGGIRTAPALSVVIAGGQAVTGLEIRFRSPDPGMTQNGLPPTPTPSVRDLPDAGSGAARARTHQSPMLMVVLLGSLGFAIALTSIVARRTTVRQLLSFKNKP